MLYIKPYLLLPILFFGHSYGMPLEVASRGNSNQESLNAALLNSAAQGNTARLLSLIEAGAEVNACSQASFTALHLAALHGHIACVNALINAKAELNVRSTEGFTPLHNAVIQGHAGCVKSLVDANAHVNARTFMISTPCCTALHFAAMYGRLECLKILLNARADIMACDSGYHVPLYHAAINGHVECVKELIKSSYLLVPSGVALVKSRKRIFNAFLQFVSLSRRKAELAHLSSVTLQFEIVSKHKLLQEDLILILLDELKKGRGIKPGALTKSKEAAVEYILERLNGIISKIPTGTLDPKVKALFEPQHLVELVKEGLSEKYPLFASCKRF